jgi:hypothetical protein
MTEVKTSRTARGGLAIEAGLHDVSEWRPTIQQFRDTVQRLGVSGGSPLGDLSGNKKAEAYMPTESEIEACSDMTTEAVAAGRLIDFGYLGNDVMMDTAKRAGPLYTNGFIGLPFTQPWVLAHSWEQGPCFYIVNPLGDDPMGADLEIMELLPIAIKHFQGLMIGDRALLACGMATDDNRWSSYPARVIPSSWRMAAMHLRDEDFMATARASAGNLLDPLVTCLMVLSTNGVRRETVIPDAKLQKARIKRGRLPLPSWERVDASAYVTAIRARLDPPARSQARGDGHHASPVAHLRRGHIRTYPEGKRTFIRDTLVNVSKEARAAFRSNRSHYEVRT